MSSVVVITVTGLEIKKVLSLSQVTSCRNIVARCKFLVTSLYNVHDVARIIRASDI